MKVLCKLLTLVAGVIVGAIAVKAIEEHAEKDEKWQDAWEHSSVPAGEII